MILLTLSKPSLGRYNQYTELFLVAPYNYLLEIHFMLSNAILQFVPHVFLTAYADLAFEDYHLTLIANTSIVKIRRCSRIRIT